MDPVTPATNVTPEVKAAPVAPAATETKTAPVQTAQSKGNPSAANVTLISKEELNKKIQAGEKIQIVNVLDPDKYTLGFIKGSIKMPLGTLDARSGELDKSKPVVTYCASSECSASKSAAKNLASKGFSVSAYEGGIKEWKEAGLPYEA